MRNEKTAKHIKECLEAALGVKPVTLHNVLPEFAEELYRSQVSREMEDAAKAFQFQSLIRNANSITVVSGDPYFYGYVAIPGAPRPFTGDQVRIEGEIKERMFKRIEEIKHNDADVRGILEARRRFVDSCADHRQLYHLWPDVASFVRHPGTGRAANARWPDRRIRIRRKLTDDETVALTKFSLMATRTPQ